LNSTYTTTPIEIPIPGEIMTKRKKQVDIIGFTKASNLLHKEKKTDNKTTPNKNTKELTNNIDQNGTNGQETDSPKNQSILSIDLNTSNNSGKTKLNDTDFFNTTVEDESYHDVTDHPASTQDTPADSNNDTNEITSIQIEKDRPYDTQNNSQPFSPNSPTKKPPAKEYGSPNWCSARSYCKNTKTPATYDYWCSRCQFSGHIECMTIGNDNDTSECICICCQPIQTTHEYNQSFMQTDTSAIQREESFDTLDITNIHEINELNNTLNPQNEKQDMHHILNQLSQNKNKRTYPDKVLHAIAIAVGADITSTHLEDDKFLTFIKRQRIWLSQPSNMGIYLQSNFYKIINKVLGTEHIKERTKQKKISIVKMDVLHEFLHMSQYKQR
jgi:hypothetical protein